ncbi:MAG: excinuclease ABC subunit UvrA [Elusimicrobiales bacterium]|nr:excinuclease ABC subunit UvrA [Elusimicrobiales bacterium]
MDKIIISGARSHNLKNISLEIPKNKLVVITGLSGSGKSSLAFDTIYAEGQRRYVESLSAYARQFLEQVDKPDVDSIEGLSPAIAIQQHALSKNPRSTAGTVTEIYDYLRLLFAKTGKPVCHKCGTPIQARTQQAITKEILSKYAGKRAAIYSPMFRGKQGTYEEVFARLKKMGFIKARVDGKICQLENPPSLKRYVKHDIDLFIDEFTIKEDNEERLTEAAALALKHSKGLLNIICGEEEEIYSENNACPKCGTSFPELEPRLFSFNSPNGACPSCMGLGVKIEIAPELVVPDETLSVNEGALAAWSMPVTTRTHRWKGAWAGYYSDMISRAAYENGINLDTPWKDLPQRHKDILLYGAGDFEGVITNLERRHKNSESDYVKEEIYSRFMHEKTCPACKGLRLKPEALSVYVNGKNIAAATALSIEQALHFFSNLKLDGKDTVIARQILKEINSRLSFLNNVGLGYVSLDRPSETLSGGEAQRIQLATQIGSGLTGVLYVLDEPTVGLHQRDNNRLLGTLKSLRDLGNTLIVVEHDEEVIRGADHIIDLGPAAGLQGGEIMAQGSPSEIMRNPNSVTGPYLKAPKKITRTLKNPSGKWLEFKGCSHFNLKNIDVKIPLGVMTGICGVSGSGKSTLMYEIIYKALARQMYRSKELPGKFSEMLGAENLDKVIIVDQSPIGRTPRSNPATYSGVFDHIRRLYAELPESRRRAFGPGRFSFNLKGGRCEACQGDGTLKISMQFLPDVYVKCSECGGHRFNEDTLTVQFKGKSIADVLESSIYENMELFKDIPKISRILKTMADVGLGYLKLGQSADTLSGGEAQRLKLAEQLSRKATGKTLYILDEPTTGLHFADIDKLTQIMHRLTESGNSVLVIEHNISVLAACDYLIELGPEGGGNGGKLIYSGSANGIIKAKNSQTAEFLREYFG